MREWLPVIWSWLYVGVTASLVVVALWRKREPAPALAWSLSIIFLPIAGPLLFLFFGLHPLPRRLRRKIEHRVEFDRRLSSPESSEARSDVGVCKYPDTDWGKLGQLLESLGEAPRREGNEVTVYCEGAAVADAFVEAIEQARHHVHVEFYIFRHDRAGRRLVELLMDRVRDGVEVRVVLDGLGSYRSLRLLKRIRKGGGQAAVFRPLFTPGRVSPNLRNHRKIVVCDGRVGFFGGMNVGEEYFGRQPRRPWFDIHLRIRGPAVLDLQRIFVEDWDFSASETIDGPEYFPRIDDIDEEEEELDATHDSPAQIIAGGPDAAINPIRQAFFSAITRARRSILLTTPYVVPDRGLRDALKSAALAGIDVRLVTQSWPPDQYLVYFCGLYYVQELIDTGVRVYRYTPGMTHAKAIAVDGEWAMAGTANLDNRSMFLNYEQMAVFDGEKTVRKIEQAIQDQIARSEEIRSEHLETLSLHEQLLANGARLFAPLL